MSAYAVHAVVTKSHRLIIDLPQDFPEGSVEIVCRPIDEASVCTDKQALGQRLRALRQKAVMQGLTTLDCDGVS
jgi:hypothetical protein